MPTRSARASDEQTGFPTLTFDWLYWALFKLNGIDLLSPDLKTPEFDTDKMAAVLARMAKSTAGTGINKISRTGRWVKSRSAPSRRARWACSPRPLLGLFLPQRAGCLDQRGHAFSGIGELPGQLVGAVIARLRDFEGH